MARLLAKAALAALILVVLVTGAARYAGGALVGSDGFRETVARQLERALKPFVPQALVAIEESELAGLSTIVFRKITARSEERIDAVVSVMELRASPRWLTLILPGPTQIEVAGVLPNGGKMTVAVATPLLALIRGRTGSDAFVEMTGNFEKADAPALFGLLFAGARGKAPAFVRGALDGEIVLGKELGTERATAKKTGHATLRFYDMAFAPFDVELDLRDYTVKIVQPFVVEALSHDVRAVVAGSMLLPRQGAEKVAWDLELTADGRPDFKDELGELFHCKQAPASHRFKVLGSVSDPRCPVVRDGDVSTSPTRPDKSPL